MKPELFVQILVALAVILQLPGCDRESENAEGAVDEPAAETVLDPLMQAPARTQQSLDAAREGHERALDAQIEASEGANAGSAADGD